MNSSTILKLGTRHLVPVLLILSLIVLYRGHNLPGGGFIGGLLGASALMLYALAHGWEALEKRFGVDPLLLIAVGLGVAFLSGLPGLLGGEAFMAGIWLPAWELPVLGKVKLGTPFVFDVGVYLTVMGFATLCAESLGKVR